MEQPKAGGEDNNDGSKKQVVEVEKKDPAPMPDQKPSEGNDVKDKCEENGYQKNENLKVLITNERGSDVNSVEVNRDGIGSNKSATPSSRSKKSVSWSQELVMESEIPRSSEDHGSNPYVAYSSTRSGDSSSFNMKSKLLFYIKLLFFLRLFVYP